jgi:AmmeMemoRadiSam system protein A
LNNEIKNNFKSSLKEVKLQKMKLTEIARKTLEAHFKGKEFELDKRTKERLKEKRACFVTLTKNGELRGCIGTLEPRQPLYKDIIENAKNAALNDPRFAPVSESELKDINIEVSVLSLPKKIKYKSPEELLKKINKKMGLILEKGYYSATFLPQVWEDLPDKVQFLEYLSMKAGLNRNAWKTADISFYTVKIEKE